MTEETKLEDNLNFYDAGMEYFKQGLAEKNGEMKPELFMKAARCLEKATPDRMTYWSWVYCGYAPEERMASEQEDHLHSSNRLMEVPEPWGMTDENWDDPASDKYRKSLHRKSAPEERDKHRRAWAYDFAAMAAARNDNHAMASLWFKKAAEAWLDCTTFPQYRRIAVKFFTYSICEGTKDIGLKNFENIFDRIEHCFGQIKEIISEELGNRGEVRKHLRKDRESERKEWAKKSKYYANYFHSIAVHLSKVGLNDESLEAIQWKNLCLRRRYLLEGERSKLKWNELNHAITRNGTSGRILLVYAIVIALLIFPCSYWIMPHFTGLLAPTQAENWHGIVTTSHTEKGEQEEQISDDIFELMYFSVVTIFSLGYGDLKPVGFARMVAMLETAVGYMLLGFALPVLFGRNQLTS